MKAEWYSSAKMNFDITQREIRAVRSNIIGATSQRLGAVVNKVQNVKFSAQSILSKRI
jgi:hypothetical protein